MMNWIKKDDYYSESEIGYRVSAAGPADDLVYAAWVKGKKRYEALGYFRTGTIEEKTAAAKQCCEQHRAEALRHDNAA